MRQDVRKSRANAAAAALGTPNSVWRGTAEAADALNIAIGGANSIASRETRSVSRVRGLPRCYRRLPKMRRVGEVYRVTTPQSVSFPDVSESGRHPTPY